MNKDVMFSSATDLWETPQSFFDALNEEFGFETDVCALPENAPEFVRKILNGSKTVEIRKTVPKCGVPVKCYIYCTVGGKGTLMVNASAGHPAITAESAYEREQAEAFGYEASNGKVVAEFTCNKIGTIYPLCSIPMRARMGGKKDG